MNKYKCIFKRLLFTTIIFVSFSLSAIMAQESINSAGHKATGSGGSVSYSVGQVMYLNNIGTNGSVSEGVQQPYEIMELTDIEEFKNITLHAYAYPNPTTDVLTLDIADYNISQLYYKVFDNNGRLLQNQKIVDNITQINMQYLPSATYYVNIYSKENQLKTFKIIKQ